MTNLTEHFTVEEMACPCCRKCDMDPDFMEALEDTRVMLNLPLKINSGYRCPKHNAEVGGVPNSEHLYGRAGDIDWSNLDSLAKFELLRLALSRFSGIGISRKFLHVDSGNVHKVWVYKI